MCPRGAHQSPCLLTTGSALDGYRAGCCPDCENTTPADIANEIGRDVGYRPGATDAAARAAAMRASLL